MTPIPWHNSNCHCPGHLNTVVTPRRCLEMLELRERERERASAGVETGAHLASKLGRQMGRKTASVVLGGNCRVDQEAPGISGGQRSLKPRGGPGQHEEGYTQTKPEKAELRERLGGWAGQEESAEGTAKPTHETSKAQERRRGLRGAGLRGAGLQGAGTARGVAERRRGLRGA